MEQWMLDLRNSVTKGETVDEAYDVSVGEINEVRRVYPMRIPRYYYNLIQEKVVLTVKLVAPNPNATAER